MTTGTSNVDERKPPQPTCKRCGQTGHLRPDCDTRIRSFTHCDICNWMGQKQMLCDHYDISPVGFRKLRGNIPFDDGVVLPYALLQAISRDVAGDPAHDLSCDFIVMFVFVVSSTIISSHFYTYSALSKRITLIQR
jgi:hypothetical protein